MKLLFAAVVGLALGGTANAQIYGYPNNEYERGWDQGYRAINPGQRGPVYYQRPFVRSPLDNRSDFQRGIADGVDRAQDDTSDGHKKGRRAGNPAASDPE
jgi:hypothetical protein